MQFGVAQMRDKCDSGSSVVRADSRSFKIPYPDFVAETLQIGTNIVCRNSEDSRDILSKYPTRSNFFDQP